MIPKWLWSYQSAGALPSPLLYLLSSGSELDRREFQILIFQLAVGWGWARLSMRFSNRHFDVNGDLIYIVIFQLKCAYIIVSFPLASGATGTKTTQLKTTEILLNFAVWKFTSNIQRKLQTTSIFYSFLILYNKARSLEIALVVKHQIKYPSLKLIW